MNIVINSDRVVNMDRALALALQPGPPDPAARPSAGWPTLFDNAFRLSANPMLLLDRDHVIIDVNAAYETALLRPRDNVVGQLADPMVALSSRKTLEHAWRALARDGRVTCTLDWTRGDGRVARVQSASVTTSLGGRGLALCVVLETRLHPLQYRDGQVEDRASLTAREIEVVSHLAMGRRIHEVAAALFISPTTARTHARNAMAKLGARSQAQLVAIAVADGLVDPGVARQV